MTRALLLAGLIVPLSLDTFALAAAIGMAGIPPERRLRTSLILSGFEAGMPIIGFLIGGAVAQVIGYFAGWTAIAFLLLAGALMRDFPEHYPLYSQREFTFNRIKQANRNRLLWSDPTVDGMKTGFTEAAGYCLLASAKRGERRLVSVVLGAQSESARASESVSVILAG